jgi:hypothetical protein
MQNLWRQAIQSLSSEVFLEIARTYLGPVKTPYRKHELLEELENFMRRPETAERVVALIDESDAVFVDAVFLMPGITREELALFLGGEEAEAFLAVANLEERLILFEVQSDKRRGQSLYINPFWEASLRDYVFCPAALFAVDDASEFSREHWREVSAFSVDPLGLAALIAFFSSREHLVKFMADGRCHCPAKTQKAFSEAFPAQWSAEDALEFLLRSRLFYRDDEQISLNQSFLQRGRDAEQTGLYLACLCAGLPGWEGRIEALLGILPTEGSFGFLAFRRFCLYVLFSAEDSSRSIEADLPARLMSALLQTGLLCSRDEGRHFFRAQAQTASGSVLRIGADGHLIVQPEVDFASFFPLAPCLDLVKLGSVAEFSVSRQSAVRAFRSSMSATDLIQRLEGLSGAALPQNLVYSFTAWEREHRAVTIAQGLVIASDARLTQFMENVAALRSAIVERLAPGVYLTSYQSSAEAEAALRNSGYETPPRLLSAANMSPRGFGPETDSYLNLFPLSPRTPGVAAIDFDKKALACRLSQREIQAALFDELASLDLPPETAEALEERIRLKLVISPTGLRPDSVRIERAEAGGLDYIGKVKLLEKARAEPGWLLDLLYRDGQGNPVRVLVRLSALKKTQSGLWLECFPHTPEDAAAKAELLRIPVERISHVKRIRVSIFR